MQRAHDGAIAVMTRHAHTPYRGPCSRRYSRIIWVIARARFGCRGAGAAHRQPSIDISHHFVRLAAAQLVDVPLNGTAATKANGPLRPPPGATRRQTGHCRTQFSYGEGRQQTFRTRVYWFALFRACEAVLSSSHPRAVSASTKSP